MEGVSDQNINKAVVSKLKEWRNSPLQFVEECLKITPTTQQIQVLSGEQSIAKHKRTSIRSGRGPGKSAVASWLILWFMVTRPFAKVVCTAPTNRQLTDILLSELSKWLRGSLVADEFDIYRDAIRHKEAPKTWWVRFISPSVRSSKEEQAETLAGLHDEHILVIVDEASGVPDPVYIPLEGILTKPDNKVLLIGNMTRNSGYFYDTHCSLS